jgi:Polyketide cyclase / dehydrase and lipid transport
VRFIKLAFISFIFLFLLITGMSLFIPSHIRISKAINIKADKDSIMAPIRDAAKWKTWYPGLDTAKLLVANGQIKGVMLDDKDPAHPVYIAITKEDPDEITAQFISKSLKPVINVWKTISYSTSDSITLQWYMDFHLRWYPWEKFGSLLLEKSYGTKMEMGLMNLKKLAEADRELNK